MRGDDWDPAEAKYRDTQRVKDALDIIEPASQHQADCERSIAGALSRVKTWREITRRTPEKQRDLLQRLAKKLRDAVDLADQLNPHDLWYDPDCFNNLNISLRMRDLENLGKLAQKSAAAADRIGKGKGAPRYSMVRYEAVERAYILLTLYSKRPGLSREGPWHRLARVLFGDEQSDLFDYMRDYLATKNKRIAELRAELERLKADAKP